MTDGAAYDEKLVYMVNQIAKNFTVHGDERAVVSTLDHIQKFWDPRMRARVLAHLQKGGAGLDPVPRRVLERLLERS